MWNRNFGHLFKYCSKFKKNPRLFCNFSQHDKIILNNWKCSFLCRPLNITAHDITKTKEHISSSECNSFTYRTHTCGELRLDHIGQNVTLCGWVHFVRLSKFLIIRDSYGITQCIVKEGDNPINLPVETIVKIEGTVIQRPKHMINRDMTTGEIEVSIDKFQVLNNVEQLPFNLRTYQKPKEQLRLQHRYIDLRFPEMQSNLRQRSTMLHSMRRFLVENHNFVEIETPTLFCRTPGGAREFVVPTHYPGLFYSLVQSPQQLKQMLMAGGIDRYFQIARCYRDETTRPDRQPEFTQLDIELSFTNLNSILKLVEDLLHATFLKELPKPPFKRLPYNHVIEKYGSDKPNMTYYGMELEKITSIFNENHNNSQVEAFALPYTNKLGKLTTKYREKINLLKKKYNVKVILNENISKEVSNDIYNNVKSIVGEQNNFIVALGPLENTCLCLGEIRDLVATLLKTKEMLKVKDFFEPLWIVDFPLFVKGDKGLETCHHPFTSPHPDDLHLLTSDPLKMRSLAYDLVLDGNEIAGGSVRIHNSKLQEQILQILNIDSEKLKHFLNALKSGCPPHAGIALGIDRLMAIACKAKSIRDVIAFPKSHEGKDPLSGAPNNINDDDKKYYHLTSSL